MTFCMVTISLRFCVLICVRDSFTGRAFLGVGAACRHKKFAIAWKS